MASIAKEYNVSINHKAKQSSVFLSQAAHNTTECWPVEYEKLRHLSKVNKILFSHLPNCELPVILVKSKLVMLWFEISESDLFYSAFVFKFSFQVLFTHQKSRKHKIWQVWQSNLERYYIIYSSLNFISSKLIDYYPINKFLFKPLVIKFSDKILWTCVLSSVRCNIICWWYLCKVVRLAIAVYRFEEFKLQK